MKTMFLLMVTVLFFSCGKGPVKKEKEKVKSVKQLVNEGKIVTLFSKDDLACSYSFSRGNYGFVYMNGQVLNKNSQVLFSRYGFEGLLFGVEAGSLAQVVDLGDIKMKSQNNSLFYFLRQNESGDIVAMRSLRNRKKNPLDHWKRKGNELLKVNPIVGHIYMVKIDEKIGKEKWENKFVLLRILRLIPGYSITFRYRNLSIK